MWWFINSRSRFFSPRELFPELSHFTNKDLILSVSVSLCWIVTVPVSCQYTCCSYPIHPAVSAHLLIYPPMKPGFISPSLLIIAPCWCHWTLHPALYLGMYHSPLPLHVCLSYLTLSSLEALMLPVFKVCRKPGTISWHHRQKTVPMFRRTV